MTRDSDEVLARFHGELDLVQILARQLARRIAAPVTVDDLASFGQEGLLLAARTFDASRGVPFRRWANLRIRGAMIDGVRQWGGLPRRVYHELRALEAGDRMLAAYDEEDAASPARTPEQADARLHAYLTGIATAITVGKVAADSAESAEADGFTRSPEEIAGAREAARRVRAVVETLPERERALIERHYFGDETIDAAAAAIGLSKSWGSRLHARAIESLARELRKLPP
ncbi:MAG TPA: sigma-70 family RNA polymerase sigma factor [Polyangiaceae bacterium]|jgi:RNA polymerase sigma factor for flagellar operon FliA